MFNVDKSFKKFKNQRDFINNLNTEKKFNSAVADIFDDILDGIFKVRIVFHNFDGLVDGVDHRRMVAA